MHIVRLNSIWFACLTMIYLLKYGCFNVQTFSLEIDIYQVKKCDLLDLVFGYGLWKMHIINATANYIHLWQLVHKMMLNTINCISLSSILYGLYVQRWCICWNINAWTCKLFLWKLMFLRIKNVVYWIWFLLIFWWTYIYLL